jgi:hypothetical protein
MLLASWATEATAWATVVLAVVTLAYVVLVAYQLKELRRQRSDEADRWSEERRLERIERARRRSEEAAWRALTVIHDSGIRPGEGSPESVKERSRDVFHALERAAPFIVDEELVDRMKAVGVLCWMMSWPSANLKVDHVDEGLLSIHVRNAVERCAAALQRHLAEEALPPWDGLPKYVDAQSWVWSECRAED